MDLLELICLIIEFAVVIAFGAGVFYDMYNDYHRD